MQTPDTMNLLIVEDNDTLRRNLVLLLDGEPGIEVVGDFGSAEEAMQIMEQTEADVLLSDLGLPGMSGVDFIRQAHEHVPDMEIMAYTVYDDRQSVFDALRAGASGYILKSATPRELVEALFTLRDGGSPMTPKIARAVIQAFHDSSDQDLLLSTREREVLQCIERGLSYKQIAEQLHISRHTVHSHIKHCYDKLQARDRQEALRKARRKGIL